MLRLLSTLLLGLGLLFTYAHPVHAQIQQRAYAPENLRNLSRSDQTRVISQEYSEQARGRRIPAEQLQFYLDQISRSSWNFNQIKHDIAVSLGAGNESWNPGPMPSGSVLCESNDNRRRQCNTGFGGRAAVSENISRTRCVEGQNWGSENGFVWVDGGCRARFVEVRGQSGWNPDNGSGSVLCESGDGQRRQCNTGFRGRAALSQNISRTRCVEGQNWGSGNGFVWVDRGCRARFVAASGSPGYGGTVRCESAEKRYRECRTGFRGVATITRTLSDARCIEGQSWGQRAGAVWVDRGCRAEFIEVQGGWNPGNGNGSWNPGGGSNEYSVTCLSQNGRRTSCAWNSRYGRPYLIQQMSVDRCLEGSSWGYFGNQLWVDRGCRARFGAR